MIPAATRRVTSSSLAIVRNAQGRQVARKTCGTSGDNATVAQLDRRKFQQTRDFSQTHPSRSALNSALQPKEKKEKGDTVRGESKNEDPLGRPEHAVISTFDLFSIGGPCSYPPPYPSKFQLSMLRRFSWSQQLTYRRPYEGWQYIYQRPERSGDFGTGLYHVRTCSNGSADSLRLQVKTVKIALFVSHAPQL